MTKLRTPLLSLDARGTIGDAVTFSHLGTTKVTKTKPVPTDRQTLLQMYQRWYYLHYCFEWQKLTPAQKHTWETNARRHRITGFNYFMRNRLTNLTNLVGYWRLDQPGGSVALDSSPNANNGTIFGAASTPGRISNGLHADGIDDYVDLGDHAVYDVREYFTILCFLRSFHTQADYAHPWAKKSFSLRASPGGEFLYMRFETASGTWGTPTDEVPLTHGAIQAIAVTYDKDVGCRIFSDGIVVSETLGVYGLINIDANPFHIFQNPWGVTKYRWHGLVDDLLFYDVVLSDADIKAHSERRYPIP